MPSQPDATLSSPSLWADWRFIVLLCCYLVVSVPLNCWFTKHRPDTFGAGVVMWLTMPGCVVLLFVAAALSIPYFFIFPERHASSIDFDGTEAEQAAMQEYRRAVSRIPLWRRLGARIGILRAPQLDFPGRCLIDAYFERESRPPDGSTTTP
jgi:hypothetical protein